MNAERKGRNGTKRGHREQKVINKFKNKEKKLKHISFHKSAMTFKVNRTSARK